MPPKPLEARFWPRVEKTAACWLWRGARQSAGYGVIRAAKADGGLLLYAHRLSYEWARGPIPDGMELDHLCRIRRCVNPDHLEAVPHTINCYRGLSLAAANAEKTHCVKGHEFTEANTVRPKRGGRQCRICRDRVNAEVQARRRLPPPDPRPCAECGKAFTPKRTRTTTMCSARCRMARFKRRHDECLYFERYA